MMGSDDGSENKPCRSGAFQASAYGRMRCKTAIMRHAQPINQWRPDSAVTTATA